MNQKPGEYLNFTMYSVLSLALAGNEQDIKTDKSSVLHDFILKSGESDSEFQSQKLSQLLRLGKCPL